MVRIIQTAKPHLVRTVEFLNSIGIDSKFCSAIAKSSFVPRVRVAAGGLQVRPDATVDSVLHEAGHLAILPACFRPLAEDDLTVVEQAISRSIEAGVYEIDSPMMRAILQSSEAEATAWAWAAGVHLGFPEKVIISDKSYQGDGKNVRQYLLTRGYFGINGLRHSGMCAHSRSPGPQYPELLRWTQTIGSASSDSTSSWLAV